MSIPKIETQSFDEVKKLQELKLVELLSYVSANSKYYQSVFNEHGIDVTQIKTLEDLTTLPISINQKHDQSKTLVEKLVEIKSGGV